MTLTLKTKLKCVHVGCGKPADWDISELNGDGKDHIWVCQEHLLDWSRGPQKTENIVKYIGNGNAADQVIQTIDAMRWVEKIKHLPWDTEKSPFAAVLDEMRDLHAKKSSDYSPGEDPLKNFHAVEAFGLTAFEGVLARLSDKWERIKNLQKKRQEDTRPAVLDESLRDTLIDLCVYGVIALNLFDEEKEPPVEAKTHSCLHTSPCECRS